MAKWSLYGRDRKEVFEQELTPENLSCELKRYQKALGKCFSIQDLLALQDIRAKALIAEAINDAPEFLIDQIGKMRDDPGGETITGCLSSIAEVLEWHLEGESTRK